MQLDPEAREEFAQEVAAMMTKLLLLG